MSIKTKIKAIKPAIYHLGYCVGGFSDSTYEPKTLCGKDGAKVHLTSNPSYLNNLKAAAVVCEKCNRIWEINKCRQVDLDKMNQMILDEVDFPNNTQSILDIIKTNKQVEKVDKFNSINLKLKNLETQIQALKAELT